MSLKSGRKIGWLQALKSRFVSARRPKAEKTRRLGTLRFEPLERRNLLSATVVVGTPAFLQNIPIISTGAQASQNGNNAFSANPNLQSGSKISYSSATQGTVNATMNGPVTSPSGQPNFIATISNMTINGQNVSGPVVVTQPSKFASTVTATGTMNTQTFATTMGWSYSGGTGSWTGTVVSTDSTPFSVSLGTPVWASSADTQINFAFTNPGTWDPTSTPATAVTSINVYWASGTTANTIIGSAIGSIPVYWNQASGSASVQGISLSTLPSGSNFVLFDVNQIGGGSSIAAFQLPPTVSAVSPSSGPLTAGTAVTIAGTDLNGATAVFFARTRRPASK